MEKVAFEKGHFFAAAETLIVEITVCQIFSLAKSHLFSYFFITTQIFTLLETHNFSAFCAADPKGPMTYGPTQRFWVYISVFSRVSATL